MGLGLVGLGFRVSYGRMRAFMMPSEGSSWKQNYRHSLENIWFQWAHAVECMRSHSLELGACKNKAEYATRVVRLASVAHRRLRLCGYSVFIGGLN